MEHLDGGTGRLSSDDEDYDTYSILELKEEIDSVEQRKRRVRGDNRKQELKAQLGKSKKELATLEEKGQQLKSPAEIHSFKEGEPPETRKKSQRIHQAQQEAERIKEAEMTSDAIDDEVRELDVLRVSCSPIFHEQAPEELKNRTLFAGMDEHAKNADIAHEETFSKLTEYLSIMLPNDTHKQQLYLVRGLFVWLCNNRGNVVHGEKPGSDNPLQLLNAMALNYMSDVDAFQILCKSSRIACEVVRGTGRKVIGYEVGDVEPEHRGHWNVVRIDGTWRIINVGWAASCVAGHESGGWIKKESDGMAVTEEMKPNTARTIRRTRIKDFWFCTEPWEYIHDCYPDDPQWQLLPVKKQIKSVQDFLRLPMFTPEYFPLGLTLSTEQTCLLTVDGDTKEITFQMAVDRQGVAGVHLMYILYVREDMKSSTGDITERMVLKWHDGNKNTSSFELRFPVAGTYKLKIYADIGIDNMPNICDFKIDCKRPTNYFRPLPIDAPYGWGCTHKAAEFGLVNPSLTTPKIPIEAEDTNKDKSPNIASLVFTIKENMVDSVEYMSYLYSRDHTELKHTALQSKLTNIASLVFTKKEDMVDSVWYKSYLYSRDHTEEKHTALQKHVNTDVDARSLQLTVQASVPSAGEFALVIEASLTETDGRTRESNVPICSYLLTTLERSHDIHSLSMTNQLDARGPLNVAGNQSINMVGGKVPARKKPSVGSHGAPQVQQSGDGDSMVRDQSAAGKSMVRGEIMHETDAGVTGITTSATTSAAATTTAMSYAGELKKQNDDTICQTEVKMLARDMTSVGALIASSSIGTCFRVGTKYIMTSWHVVRGIVGHESGGWIKKESDGMAVTEEMKPNTARTIRRTRIKDFWFCTEPWEYIHDCYPDDPQWQLLPVKKQIKSVQDFLRLPMFTPEYFPLGLTLSTEQTCLLTVDGDTKEITFQMAVDRQGVAGVHLMYILYVREDMKSSTGDITERMVLKWHDGNKNTSSFELRFPVAGTYKLKIYADIGIDNMPNICDFKIDCKRPTNYFRPLPIDAPYGWGCTHKAAEFGLVNPSLTTPKIPIEAEDTNKDKSPNIASLVFTIKENMVDSVEYMSYLDSRDHTELKHTALQSKLTNIASLVFTKKEDMVDSVWYKSYLYSRDHTEEKHTALQKHVNTDVDARSLQLTVQASVPSAGEFALVIEASLTETDGRTRESNVPICSYLLTTLERSHDIHSLSMTNQLDARGPLNVAGNQSINMVGGKVPARKKPSVGSHGAPQVQQSGDGDSMVRDQSAAGKSMVRGEIMHETDAGVTGITTSATTSAAATTTAMSYAGELKKQNDDTICQTEVKMLARDMTSVGALIASSSIGTCFRVGTKYIMTSWHVVRGIVDPAKRGSFEFSKLEDESVFVNFNEDPMQPCLHRFRVQATCSFIDTDLDIALLELKDATNAPLPLTLCKTPPELTHISFVGFGHPNSSKKHLDPRCSVLPPTCDTVKAAHTWLLSKEGYIKRALKSQSKDQENLFNQGYFGYDNPIKVLFHCYMEKGSSGGPGFILDPYSQKTEVVSVLTNGSPVCYWELPAPAKSCIPPEYRIEMATRITAVEAALKKNPAYHPLGADIFS